MCLAALPSALHGRVAPSTKFTARRPTARSWRNRLSAVVLHVADGLQSSMVPAWRAPVTCPTYWARLLSCSSVSFHSGNQLHCAPSACRYGMPGPNPAPISSQLRFSNENTTTDSYRAGGASTAPQGAWFGADAAAVVDDGATVDVVVGRRAEAPPEPDEHPPTRIVTSTTRSGRPARITPGPVLR